MEGVILFADDKLETPYFTKSGSDRKKIAPSDETKLLAALNQNVPVLGVRDLKLAKVALQSAGAFTAIILDWEFGPREVDELPGVQLPDRGQETFDFLKENQFYSLVYIFSSENVADSAHGLELKEIFGERIRFRTKLDIGKTRETKNAILKEIRDWKKDNQRLKIPILWLSMVNRTAQSIFKSLAEADGNWIRELHELAVHDGVDAEMFVTETFQSLLQDHLAYEADLMEAIRIYATNSSIKRESVTSDSLVELFRRLIYTKRSAQSPIMTGDILKISNRKFGVVITPECDVRTIRKNNASFDVLTFSENTFDQVLSLPSYGKYKRRTYEEIIGKRGGKRKLANLCRVFSQTETRFHILPTFPVDGENKNRSVATDFSQNLTKFTFAEVEDFITEFKLNSPFLHQLRQRYIAHLGRVGVTAFPQKFSEVMLKP